MIVIKDRVFQLLTNAASYLFCINEHGHPEHIHFGGRVDIGDTEALRYKHTLPYGSEVLYSPEDSSYCLDNVPLEWSGIGKGDFRVTPIELEMPDGSYVTDFVYRSHKLLEGVCPPKGLPGAAAESRDAQTLLLTLADTVFPVELDLYYTVFPMANVIIRRAVLRNSTDKPLTLHRMLSMLIDLPDRAKRLLTLSGDWISETALHECTIVPGCFVNESTTGASSNRHNPAIALATAQTCEDSGEVWGFNLIYSGNHYTAVELSSRHMVRVTSGLQPQCFCARLAAGECFETPEAVLTYSANGFNGMSRSLHAFIQSHIVRGEWHDKERPILVNNWEAHFFDFTRSRLLRLARRAKSAGAELFVLDDGWFGKRNNDKAGLGDYTVNTKKLPGGLERLGRSINRLGLRFGLWFEPESVNPDSELFRLHPEYAVRLPSRTPSFGRNQLLLDLTRREVRNYIVENVSHILDTAPISYVKWDMNRHMSDAPGGFFAHSYMLGLYEILERIFRPRPHILLESCSSGGNRFDLGMLCYSPQIWASDDTDPIERLRIQRGLSYFYPPSCMGSHVSQSPHQQTLRLTPLSTRFNVAAFGAFGYELDLGELSRTEKAQVQEQISFYKKWRPVFQYGTFYRSEQAKANKVQFTCVARDKGRAVTLLAQTLAIAAESNDVLRIPGLQADAVYILRSVPQRVAVSRFGGLVKHLLPIRLRADGLLLRLANRLYALPDGRFTATATGAAFADGIGLNNQFIGTGYHKELRLWGDFGSQLYTLEMKKEEAVNEPS